MSLETDGATADALTAVMRVTLSFSSTTIRSAVRFPTPEIFERSLMSADTMADAKSETESELSTLRASFGPTPLTSAVSILKSAFSASV